MPTDLLDGPLPGPIDTIDTIDITEPEARTATTEATNAVPPAPLPTTRPRPAHPTVTVVIPTRNEARNLTHVLRRLPDGIDEVVLVDGHSTDGTVEAARRIRPDVKVVMQPGKGKGNALAHGFRAATGDIIVMIDADGSTCPTEIPSYVAALRNGADFAKGSRFLATGGSTDITKLRAAGNGVLVGVVNWLYGTSYTDLCYGYNAFWRDCLPAMAVDCDGFEVETLINIRIARAGLRVAEVPSIELERIHGMSNLHAGRDGLRVLRTILQELRTPPARRHTGAGPAAGPRAPLATEPAA